MLRNLAQTLDVSLDEFWCSVVVVEHGERAIDQSVVYLPCSDIDGEDDVDDVEDDDVQDMAHGRANSLTVVESRAIVAIGGLRFVDGLFW